MKLDELIELLPAEDRAKVESERQAMLKDMEPDDIEEDPEFRITDLGKAICPVSGYADEDYPVGDFFGFQIRDEDLYVYHYGWASDCPRLYRLDKIATMPDCNLCRKLQMQMALQ